jgi:Electron transfer DM13
MKRVTFLLMAVIVFASCKKSNDTPTAPATDGKPAGTVIATAKIVEGTVPGDKANGDAMVYNNNGVWKLYLTNFSSVNGPDLRVYLATNSSVASFIDLGKLKSTSGNQTYDITGNPDLKNYKYVIIWCKQFSVYFGGGQFN